MLKRSKSPTSILIAAMSLIVFAASVPALPQTAKVATPIKGIGVVIKKNPGDATARTTQTDAEGNFTVSGLEAGRHDLRLTSEKHDGMDAARVELTLTGTTAGEFKRTISTRELAAGVVIPIEISARGDKLLTGHVTLIK